jgi:predicted  nucleic acid-binding Zn ribbon protein
MVVLTEDDQLAMLNERQCPRCGSTIEQAVNMKGIAYLRCNTCKYYAGIEDGHPYVNREHLDGVTPIRHDS